MLKQRLQKALNLTEAKLKGKIYKLLKKTMDDTFELYIRYRDNWKCITCSTEIPNDTELMHAGHYVDRGNLPCRWNEKNVNGQCGSCNAKEHFTKNKAPYTLAMIRKYGVEVIDELNELSKQQVKFHKSDLIEKILCYRDKIKEYIWQS